MYLKKFDKKGWEIRTTCKKVIHRGWFSKFATGLNIIIGIYEGSSCPFAKMIPFSENHFVKITALSLIYFLNYLQPIMIFSPVANFGNHPLSNVVFRLRSPLISLFFNQTRESVNLIDWSFFKLMTRLIPQDLFMFFQVFGPTYSCFFNLLARLIPRGLLMFFQTFGSIYSTRLIHVFFKLLARLIPQDLFMFFSNFGLAYSRFFKLLARLIHI